MADNHERSSELQTRGRRVLPLVAGAAFALLQAGPGFTQESEAIGVAGATTIETVQVTATRRRAGRS